MSSGLRDLRSAMARMTPMAMPPLATYREVDRSACPSRSRDGTGAYPRRLFRPGLAFYRQGRGPFSTLWSRVYGCPERTFLSRQKAATVSLT